MENTYSITVTNKFSLALDEDEDPLEILKLREQEREAKKKEKLNEKERAKQQQEQQPHKKQQSEASNKPKPRANKENQHQQIQPQQQQQEQKQQPQAHQRNQDAKKDQGEKKLNQTKFGGAERDRNVKFESREEHNNRRNREDGERPPRAQNDFKRGPPGEVREPRGDSQRGDQQPYREFRNSEFGTGERRGRGGGRGMGRGGRGGGGFREGRGGGGRGGGYDNRDKREHDRRSGSDKTGIKPIDKRDGAGSHNWGTHNDEIEESLNTSDDWNNEQQPESTPATGANDSAGSTGAEPTAEGGAATEDKPAEEEARELTLDEWKALRQTRNKPQYNLRKAGEGEDPSRWKKMYALEKKKEEAEEGEEDEEFDVAAEYPQRVGRQKHLFNIEINFGDSRRSAGGRGGRGGRGRGGDRGGGDRGERGGGAGRGFNRGPPRNSDDFRNNEQRSPRERQNAPKVDDEHDFPSLG